MSGQTEIIWGEAFETDSSIKRERRQYQLGDLVELITKGTTPSTLGGRFVEAGINFIKSEAIGHNGRIDKSVFVRIDEATHAKLKRSQLKENDILFSMAGIYLGKNAIVTKDVLPANTNQALAIIRLDKTKADTKFIHYYLRQASVTEFVNNMSGQSAQPNINFQEIRSIDILLPELQEQRAIASVLSSLDDKIDLLYRQNATLEALAEILFKQWFVEEAKEEWEKGVLEDFFTLQRGFDLPIQNRVPGKFPIITSSGYSAGHNEYKVKGPGVVTGRSGVIGKVFFVLEDFWPLNTSLFIKEYKLGTPLFSYFTLKFADLESFNAGSAVPTLNRNHVHAQVAAIPPKKLIETFEGMAYPHFKKIDRNTKQIQTLSTLRDTLLPKLMSGEVRVAY
jgi:type I restriction enzyme S subunit